MAGPLTTSELETIWDRYEAGSTSAKIARQIGRDKDAVRRQINAAGGIRPTIPRRAAQHLTLAEREEISRGLAAGHGVRRIARELGRAPSTISREIARNRGRSDYRATTADRAATVRRRRPKTCKLAASPQLRRLVQHGLEHEWAPEQIAGWLKREHPNEPELHVSHETIYRTLFVQSRGALRKDLTEHLRTRRSVRSPHHGNQHKGQGRGQITNAIHISERPAEAEDRAVPGHWEGDLMLGSGMSGVAILVERFSRFVMLIELPEGIKSQPVVAALASHVQTLPEQLRRSLTWDRGLEMARHLDFTIDTGVTVYFCDPKSPWQKGTAENTIGLLRQYFPKRTSLKPYSQTDLDAVAERLNGRPRKTLGFMTPAEKFAEAVASTR